MTGLIYNEFKQNKIYIFLITAAAALAVIFPVLFYITFEDKSMYAVLADLTKNSGTKRAPFLILGFVAAGALQGLTMKGNDRKTWSYFVSSVPQGFRGYIRIKYEMILSMSLLMLVSCIFFDDVLCSVVYSVTERDLASAASSFTMFFYIQILLRAAELPFLIRFGLKTGSLIKTIIILTGVVIISVLMVFNPCDVMMRISEFIINQNKLGDTGRLLLYSFPFAAAAAYFMSYKISCKLYMKGAEHYDK
ncbi:MAG: ABC-2 transporter permease [Oscillospiraceae bacterium]|nr:ABC-2 transporter permease [Oscillospiraceae bacterium]